MSFILDTNFVVSYRENQSQLKVKARRFDEVERQLGESQQENQSLRQANKELLDTIRQQRFENLCNARKRAKSRFFIESFIYCNAKILLWILFLILMATCVYFESKSLKSPLGIFSGVVSLSVFFYQICGNIKNKAVQFMYKRYRYYVKKMIHSNQVY